MMRADNLGLCPVCGLAVYRSYEQGERFHFTDHPDHGGEPVHDHCWPMWERIARHPNLPEFPDSSLAMPEQYLQADEDIDPATARRQLQTLIQNIRHQQERTTMRVKFKKLHPAAVVPERQTSGAAGLDLATIEAVAIAPGERRLIKTAWRLKSRRATKGRCAAAAAWPSRPACSY